MSVLPGAVHPRPSWLVVPGALFVALFAGQVGALGSPFIAAILSVLLLAVAAYAYLGRRLSGLFLAVLILVLAGYAFFGRGFSYIGVAPLYIGEVTLAIGLGALFANGLRARLNGLHLALLAFMAWGVLTTVPYLATAQVDALRDAAFWGYAVFALLIWALVSRREQFAMVTRAYRFVLPLFLLAVPAIWIVTTTLASIVPSFPGAPVPLITMKAGDIGVHLAGIAAFILLGLYRGRGRPPRVPEAALWVVWAAAFLIVVVTNRGGFLSASVGLAAIVVLRPSLKLVPLALAGGVLLTILVLANPSMTVNGRVFSPERVTDRAVSIFDRSGERQGTVNWRLDWWDTIIGYTVQGDHFWTGKGFGANLAEEDGFLGQAQGLRSPHNATMTALARMGVPGLVFWLTFHIGFGVAMLRAYLRAQRAHDLFWAPILGWILVYWGAGIVNGSFDVYWEGPQGAIWMWTVIGLGLAALEIQRREADERRIEGAPRELMQVAR